MSSAALAKALDEVLERRRRAGHRVRRLGHRRPARRDPGRGRGDRRARSSISACRSIPATCCWSADARGRPVLGAPGCARSPKENGFDWVLMRLARRPDVPREAITGLGVGGLLMEIVTRPQPRDGAGRRSRGRRIAARGARRRPLDPHGRAQQAPRRNRRQAAGAHRRRAGARLARQAGDRRDRPSARAGRGGARRPAGAVRAQSGFRRGPRHLAARPASPRCRRRPTARSSASATCRRSMRALIDRLIAAFDPEQRRAGRGADVRRQARQSGAVVAALLPRSDGDRGRCRRAPSDRPLRRGRGRSAGRRATAALIDVDTPEALIGVKAEIEGT